MASPGPVDIAEALLKIGVLLEPVYEHHPESGAFGRAVSWPRPID
ncbi:MAG TPA: hypothetical protein VMW69_00125 [Spirochaetia bacterium]|nr:hypothetical protein [Spirochaetia bacterium]